jgi:predicted tellurium resistance membrane protein TerC
MEGLLNPVIGFGFLALVALELVFAVGHVAYSVKLSESLAPQARARAQALGLLSALLVRVALLVSVVWLIQFTTPFLAFICCFGRPWPSMCALKRRS